ncbi:hypothetical protein EGM87_14685 [Sphingobium sp. RSMS]|uniref:hypothetical protein n=1 Tax=Sphingobium sp. RSMS TaxID=520734 RepID=UPI0010F6F2B7|nr:hypothetical protein [Sphingobium sp. RSMS]UXC90280.1 hypothetical protein EGM87_14685 [Sphingobium sp. RSMS]
MHALAKVNQGDLPALLDTLTVAVTTLDAVGVENYRELYLYVMGTTGEEVVRDLRVEDGHLIVGPPADGSTHFVFRDRDFESDRRALLLAELGNIMRIWKWPPKTMASYLRCSEAMLSTWIGRSIYTEVPVLPQAVIVRIKRLSIIDRSRFLSGVSDQDMPRWLSSKRASFGRRSIEQLIQIEDESASFIQLVLWSLNSRQNTTAIN